MVAAFNRDDVDAVIDAFDERCEIVEPPEMPDSPSAGYRGHEGIREWMANLRGVAGVHFESVEFTTSGDAIVWELASHGLGQASGVPMGWRTFALVEMRGEKIARVRVFLTREQAFDAVGRE